MTPSYLPSARRLSSPTTLQTISNPILTMTWKRMARTTTATMASGSLTLYRPSLPHLQSTMLSPLLLAAAAAAAAQSTTVYKEKQAHQQRRCYQRVMDLGEPKEDGHPKGPIHWSEPWRVDFMPKNILSFFFYHVANIICNDSKKSLVTG